ncbi:hypothetical protein MUP77_00645 [Candidatus Bathyarchaeota archaeon]|nr:hypothetical protein [Candidatus Bathyarchaeota archaeon]
MAQKTDLAILGKDIIATLTQTNFPDGVPDIDAESDILEVFALSGVTATATQAQTIDAYNATDWADATKPATAHHIMFNLVARKWKMKDALAAGDMLLARVVAKGVRVETS